MSSINWETVKDFEDITYKKSNGVARIAFNRPDVRNAFRPKTTSELYQAFYDAQEDTSIGVVLLSVYIPFAVVVTKRREDIRAMWAMTECTALIFWKCSV